MDKLSTEDLKNSIESVKKKISIDKYNISIGNNVRIFEQFLQLHRLTLYKLEEELSHRILIN